jgi:3-phosphoshikimate 1-carboxyvinyltransferase
MSLRITGIKGLRGEIKPPGDKSISHRALILGALARGNTAIRGFLNTGDCLNTAGILTDLGVDISGIGTDRVVVMGKGLPGLKEAAGVLDAGNSATTARLMMGVLAGTGFMSVIDGDDSLRRRPMERVIEPLKQMGAHIHGYAGSSRLPVAIQGMPLTGIDYVMPVASAQIKSSLLLAGLSADGKTTVSEPHTSRDHTERMMEAMGALIKIKGTKIEITGGSELAGIEVDVPGDFSSAAFFITAALLSPSSNLTITGVGMNSARIGLLDAYKAMGARITYDAMTIKNKEARATIHVQSSRLSAVKIGPSEIPRLIDEIPILAVAATQAEGTTVIKGADELRLKESDRLAAVAENLKKMGADIKETHDGLRIKGPSPLKGAAVSSQGDHRMAMALVVAGLIAGGETIIDDEKCIDVSFPDFDKEMKRVAV